jgi:hypothetical protein
MAFWDGTRWVPEPGVRRMTGPTPAGSGLAVRRLSLAVMSALLLALPAAAFAGKATSSVWVNELGGDGAGALQRGDSFTVGYASREREPYGLARCYPNATTEYIGTHADGSIWGQVFSVYEGGPTPQAFQLGASVYPLWIGGGADCTVELVTYSRNLRRVSVLARTEFTAAP